MLSDLYFRLRSLLRRGTVENELDDELRFHLEQQVEKKSRVQIRGSWWVRFWFWACLHGFPR